jgi:predicted kinase
VVLTGLAGSGKSRFAQQLAAVAPVVVITTDRARKLLCDPPQHTTAEDERMHRATAEVIMRLLQMGIAVVRDAATVSEAMRADWVARAQAVGARAVVIELTAMPATIRERLAVRAGPDRDPWDYSDAQYEHYLQMAERYEPVRLLHLLIDSERDYQSRLDDIAALVTRGDALMGRLAASRPTGHPETT